MLTLHGQVNDPAVLSMMERIGQETLATFSTHDFLLVDLIHREQPVPEPLRARLPVLVDLGVIERVARGDYILGRRYYAAAGKQGVYTRKKGLHRDARKALLLQHISENAASGSRLSDLHQVLPAHGRGQLQVLLRELRAEGKVHVRGLTKSARWYPGPG